MKRSEPHLSRLERGRLLFSLVEAQQEEQDICNLRFENEELEGFEGERLEFRGCVFSGCRLAGNRLRQISFTDCLLEGCDLSNLDCSDGVTQRVIFHGCKAVGLDFCQGFFQNTLFEDCDLRYANLNQSVLKEAEFRRCNLTGATLDDCDARSFSLEECDLTGANLRRLPLGGKDLRSCRLDGVILVGEELHGATISVEQALELANAASREHPCRVIAISPRRGNGARKPVEGAPKPAEDADAAYDNSNLDAQVRFGADAGAGEIIVLHPRGGLVHHPDTLVIPLLVPDAPVVAWWPNEAPANPSKDLLGAMARSRLTDAMHSSNPYRTIEDLRRNWSPKNVDMAWTRLTVWRAMLATMLDQPPHLPISTVKVSGPKGFLPMDLLAAWLRLKLNVPVIMEEVPGATAVTGVYLTRADGTLSLERPDAKEGIAVISTPGQSPQSISVPTRTLEECLSEELRQLDPDEVYAEVITQGWNLIHPAE